MSAPTATAQMSLAPFRFTGPCDNCGRETYGDGGEMQVPYDDPSPEPKLTYLTFWWCNDCAEAVCKQQEATS